MGCSGVVWGVGGAGMCDGGGGDGGGGGGGRHSGKAVSLNSNSRRES